MSRRGLEGPGPWRSARTELAIAGAGLVAAAISAYAVAGGPATVLVVVIFSVVALAVVDRLLPTGSDPEPRPEVTPDRRASTGSFINHWRWRMGLKDATKSMVTYQIGLGPSLEHLLAARLSEHHGVNLYREPEAARAILCANGRDLDLWSWVDPDRLADGPGAPQPEAPQPDAPGISPRALARLVERLEQL